MIVVPALYTLDQLSHDLHYHNRNFEKALNSYTQELIENIRDITDTRQSEN
jgi:hypothetical protein